MSAKDNFAQAMKELLNSGSKDNDSGDTEEKASPGTFSSFSKPEARPPKAPAPEKQSEKPAAQPEPEVVAEKPAAPEPVVAAEKPAPAPAPKPAPAPVQKSSTGSIFSSGPSNNTYTQQAKPVTPAEPAPKPVVEKKAPVSIPPQPTTPAVSAPTPAPAPAPIPAATPVRTAPGMAAPGPGVPPEIISDEVSVITPGTTIVGDINTNGALKINGSIKGNVHASATVELTGRVIGDIEADEVVINASIVKGNINARSTVTIDGGTTVVGDVSGRLVETNGKIKGNLTAEERGHFQANSILVGNLVSGTVVIDEGAMLKGDISITNAQAENVSVEEPEIEIDLDF